MRSASSRSRRRRSCSQSSSARSTRPLPRYRGKKSGGDSGLAARGLASPHADVPVDHAHDRKRVPQLATKRQGNSRADVAEDQGGVRDGRGRGVPAEPSIEPFLAFASGRTRRRAPCRPMRERRRSIPSGQVISPGGSGPANGGISEVAVAVAGSVATGRNDAVRAEGPARRGDPLRRNSRPSGSSGGAGHERVRRPLDRPGVAHPGTPPGHGSVERATWEAARSSLEHFKGSVRRTHIVDRVGSGRVNRGHAAALRGP